MDSILDEMTAAEYSSRLFAVIGEGGDDDDADEEGETLIALAVRAELLKICACGSPHVNKVDSCTRCSNFAITAERRGVVPYGPYGLFEVLAGPALEVVVGYLPEMTIYSHDGFESVVRTQDFVSVTEAEDPPGKYRAGHRPSFGEGREWVVETSYGAVASCPFDPGHYSGTREQAEEWVRKLNDRFPVAG